MVRYTLGMNQWSDYPHLLAEIDMSKNKNHTYNGKPCSVLDLSPGTSKKLDWKCLTCNHEWQATGNNRVTKKGGCPSCNRGDLHSEGRNSMANTHPKLAEEYQGDATKIIAGTHKKLDWKCSTCGHQWNISGSHRVFHPKCGACDNKVIHSDGLNAMATTHPNLATEYQGDATKVVAGTMKILDWKCLVISETPCRHEWKSNGDNRVRGGNGCPPCGEEKRNNSWQKTNLEKMGSMAVTHPNLALEYQGDANLITVGNNKKLLWKCLVISDNPCGNIWEATGNHRYNGTGCPECAESGFKVGEPGYCYLLEYQFSDGVVRYKQGITNNEVKYRLARLKSAVNKVFPETKVTLIGQIYFDVGQDALDLENHFKSISEIRWTPEQNFEGSTEMYAEGILEVWVSVK